MSLEEPIQFTLNDQIYHVSRLTQEIQDKFGLWVEQQAFKILRHSRSQMNDQEYNHLLSEHQKMKRLGQFELYPGSEAWNHLIMTADGYKYMIWLCFRKYQGTTPEEISAMMEAHEEEFKPLIAEILASKKKWLIEKNVGGSCLPLV